MLYNGMQENNCSEQASRMSAMENSTKNASEILDKLTLSYNRWAAGAGEPVVTDASSVWGLKMLRFCAGLARPQLRRSSRKLFPVLQPWRAEAPVACESCQTFPNLCVAWREDI